LPELIIVRGLSFDLGELLQSGLQMGLGSLKSAQLDVGLP
jgi:hypothetical protein